eukprot:TRINITY_DN13537_c0_g1_i1.p2 TRINITY_DN13537_c0_g1~~TRINITY_DN13537_c0_g1_i1.p2  ORF type:complete len:168 (+),score=24.20 TRINITY_DN13537_c0_g1_i1:248-751(+)
MTARLSVDDALSLSNILSYQGMNVLQEMYPSYQEALQALIAKEKPTPAMQQILLHPQTESFIMWAVRAGRKEGINRSRLCVTVQCIAYPSTGIVNYMLRNWQYAWESKPSLQNIKKCLSNKRDRTRKVDHAAQKRLFQATMHPGRKTGEFKKEYLLAMMKLALGHAI